MWYNNSEQHYIFVNKKKLFSMEFFAVVAVIFITFLLFWFLFYLPAIEKAAVAVFKSNMKSLQTGLVMCDSSETKIKSGSPGDPLCGSSSAGTYPSLAADCETEPYFSVSFTDGKDWKLDTFKDKSLAEHWDCHGCRLSCTSAGCEESVGCK